MGLLTQQQGRLSGNQRHMRPLANRLLHEQQRRAVE